MKTQDHRVLLLSPSAFNKITGGGITFSNLFLNWPKGSLASIHNDEIPVTYETCNYFYRLSNREVSRWGWLRYLPKANSKKKPILAANPNKELNFISLFIKFIKRTIFGDGIPQEVRISSALDEWIRTFRPTVLYTILGSNAMMELAEKLCDRFQLPLVIHIMDDWPNTIYKGGIFSPFQRRKKDRLLQNLLKIASNRLAISEDMARAYEIRYKLPFKWFQNAIDLTALRRFVKRDASSVCSPVRVVYIGSILTFAQLESLIDCCCAIQQLNEQGFPIYLEIYSPTSTTEQYRGKLVVGSAITLKDTIVDDELFFGTLQGADILLLPVNFDKETINYIRYSMPTKVPAYLAVGTPILVYGPSLVAQVSYAINEGWGFAVTVRNIDVLKSAFVRISTDAQLRKDLSYRSLKMAEMHHDARVVREQFQNELVKASVRYGVKKPFYKTSND